MKALILALLISLATPFGDIRNLEDAFESCDIVASAIKYIVITADGQAMVSVELDSVFSTEVVDVLEPDGEGRFHDIPDGTELSNLGLIIWRGKNPANWSSFGVVENEELGRYWLILFPTNIFVTDSISCGAFEIILDVEEGA